MMFSANIEASDKQAKHAALLLHAMAPADRHWLLNQLTAAKRNTLEQLLSELAELSIPADASLVEKLILREQASAAPVSRPNSDADGDRDFLASLDTTGITALAKAWAAEPPYLVAQALSIQPWPWKSALLAQLPALQQRRVVEILHHPPTGIDAKNLRTAAMMRSMRNCCSSSRDSTATTAQAAQVPTRLGSRISRLWTRKGREA